MTCAVATCDLTFRNKKNFVSCYSFPSDKKLRIKWLSACKRKDIKSTSYLKKYHKICSMHFTSECFTYHLSVDTVKISLKPLSVPTLNLPGPKGTIQEAITYEDHILSLKPIQEFLNKSEPATQYLEVSNEEEQSQGDGDEKKSSLSQGDEHEKNSSLSQGGGHEKKSSHLHGTSKRKKKSSHRRRTTGGKKSNKETSRRLRPIQNRIRNIKPKVLLNKNEAPIQQYLLVPTVRGSSQNDGHKKASHLHGTSEGNENNEEASHCLGTSQDHTRNLMPMNQAPTQYLLVPTVGRPSQGDGRNEKPSHGLGTSQEQTRNMMPIQGFLNRIQVSTEFLVLSTPGRPGHRLVTSQGEGPNKESSHRQGTIQAPIQESSHCQGTIQTPIQEFSHRQGTIQAPIQESSHHQGTIQAPIQESSHRQGTIQAPIQESSHHQGTIQAPSYGQDTSQVPSNDHGTSEGPSTELNHGYGTTNQERCHGYDTRRNFKPRISDIYTLNVDDIDGIDDEDEDVGHGKGLTLSAKKCENQSSELSAKFWRRKCMKNKTQIKNLQTKLRQARLTIRQQSAWKSAVTMFSKAQLKRLSKPASRTAWDQDSVAKALALKSISNKAYGFVTNVLKYPLPSPSSLIRWIRNFQTPPGILTKSLDLLLANGLLKSESERLTVLSFGEMPIKSQCSNKSTSDAVNFPSRNVQVAMARGLIDRWKQPVYYNFDEDMTKENLLRIIYELHKISYTVVAVVCNQGDKNQALYNSLDNLTIQNSSFTHPDITGSSIWFLYDVPQALKNLRNHILDRGLALPDGNILSKQTFEDLLQRVGHEFSESYKVSQRHLNVQGQDKQSIRLAAQLLSESSSRALHKYLPQYFSQATFITNIDKAFDVLNSSRIRDIKYERCAYGMKLQEQEEALKFLTTDIPLCRVIGHEKILPCQEALIIAGHSIPKLFSFLCDKYDADFILTSRLNQDCIKHFFSCVRRIGTSAHPDCSDFEARFKILLLGLDVPSSLYQSSSVEVLDESVQSDENSIPYCTAASVGFRLTDCKNEKNETTGNQISAC